MEEDTQGLRAKGMPSEAGRTAVVTGTGGLGWQCALGLARLGGEVIIAGRNAQKGAAAVDGIRAILPEANARFQVLDLADLKSIADFGAWIHAGRRSIDLLINNAAVMAPPRRRTT